MKSLLKKAALCSSLLTLSACMGAGDYAPPETPTQWQAQTQNKDLYKDFKAVENNESLKTWWALFNDKSLDHLIEVAMQSSPDRAIALAKVKEARGVERTARSSLLPQLIGVAQTSREDAGSIAPDNYYNAAFDASFEIDLFGKNRNASNAANLQTQAAEAGADDVTLTLVADTARTYMEYRYYQKQVAIASRNLESEEKTLELIRLQYNSGEAPQLDVERAENQVNITRANLPEYTRYAEAARLRLSILTGVLPQSLDQMMTPQGDLPVSAIAPVLASPAFIMENRPDIRAARLAFAAATKTAMSETANLFPNITLSALYGVQDSAFVSSTSVWSVVLGMAVNLLDFGRIEGRIDSAQAREEQAYHGLRKAVLTAVTDVEQSMVSYAYINKQRVALNASLGNARKALDLSQQLYKEGEISFLDVLDAQRSVNNADSAAIKAEFDQVTALIALYKSLGVY